MSALDALVLRVGNEDEHSTLPVDVYTGTGEHYELSWVGV